MKIATWNINSIRVRSDQLCGFLKRQNIDVMLLQEIKCITPLFPCEIFEDIGYNCAVFGQKTYNGVAILSKYMMDDVRLGTQIFQDDHGARYIDAFINKHRIVSIYVPNGQVVTSPAYVGKLEFLGTLRAHLENVASSESCIIGGDFNIARHDVDVYDPVAWRNKVCCTDPERETLERILDIGFMDCGREIAGPAKPIYTWWDYKQNSFSRNKGLRLDYLLATKNVLTKDCYVDTDMRMNARPSDHAPIVLEVR
ncbi:MAG: exodeoxyribonuclease III [Holosporales bacterium]|jgi:exodeoxyribonuclease-3|nr:exodeoxyribonuclease III [Holosporales bacterium]